MQPMSLKVAVITQNDPYYMPLFFEEFLPRLREVTVEQVTILSILDEDILSLGIRMLSFYGPANFTRRLFGYAYRNILDSIGTGNYSVESVAQSYDVPTNRRNGINTEEYISWVEKANIDIVLSVASSQIFEEELLRAPNYCCLNIHTAKLPQYRGVLPTFWALYHGEDEIGITIHTMVSEIDRGEIANQMTFPTENITTLDEAIKRGKREGGELAARTLNDIANESISMTDMKGDGSYFSFPTKADRKEFQKRGYRLL